MSFRAWFVIWINSFVKLLTLGGNRHKSDAQRRRERRRRNKRKPSWRRLYEGKKKRAKRRSSLEVGNERALGALFTFCAASLAVLFLPIGLFDWAAKSSKARKSRLRSAYSANSRSLRVVNKSVTGKSSPGGNASSTSLSSSAARSDIKHIDAVEKTSYEEQVRTVHNSKTANLYENTIVTDAGSNISSSAKNQPVGVGKKSNIPELMPIERSHTAEFSEQGKASLNVCDESTPKSTPKNINDRYMRKRMLIDTSDSCSSFALDSLTVGAMLDFAEDGNNPIDKYAISIISGGERLGRVARSDALPLLTCLKLGQKIYGVLTDKTSDENHAKYEFEVWISSGK